MQVSRFREHAKRAAIESGTAVAVDDSGDTLVAAANSTRLQIDVCNLSDAWVYLKYAEEGAVVGEGLPLAPGGLGSFSTTKYTGPICAVHAATGEGKTLSVAEV